MHKIGCVSVCVFYTDWRHLWLESDENNNNNNTNKRPAKYSGHIFVILIVDWYVRIYHRTYYFVINFVGVGVFVVVLGCCWWVMAGGVLCWMLLLMLPTNRLLCVHVLVWSDGVTIRCNTYVIVFLAAISFVLDANYLDGLLQMHLVWWNEDAFVAIHIISINQCHSRHKNKQTHWNEKSGTHSGRIYSWRPAFESMCTL